MNDSAIKLLPAPGYSVPATEPERLKSLSDTELFDTPAEEGFDRITRLAQQLFGVSTALVTLVGQDRQFFKSVAGDLEMRTTPRDVSFCTHTILTPDALIVEDASEDDRFSSNPLVLGQPNIRFYAGQPLQGPGGHNIGSLCIIDQKPRTLSADQQQVLKDLAAIAQREINVSTDLRNAAKIQHAHLPARAPSVPGYTITAVSRPAGELSGDFYDWHLNNSGLQFTVADVMGKGTGPAILTATVRACLRATAHHDPATALETVSEELLTGLARAESFVTAFHAELEPATGTVRYSDAGHGLAHHLPARGPVQRLPAAGAPMGIMPGMQWRTRSLVLGPGDCLIVPSDGVLGMLNEDLDDLATELKKLSTSTNLRADLDLLAARRTPELTDDVTVLILKRD